MSVKLKFVSPADGRGVTRSRSFAGFSPLASTKSRNYTVCGTSVRSKMSPVKSVKVYPPLHKGSGGMVPQPQQVEKIVRALRRGLNEYLELRQIELDFLTSQQKDTKRNSRLAFLYDLDKQTRSIERYIRKLEFHISKVEELYESYCLHRRLRDGASSMKQAFSSSSRSTKASRESLVELHRNFKECTEDMCILEGALETHLGEFYIRMKGLVGFARLCPGDQYEVFLKLGHQKWKLKGKIEADDRQLWDEEEVVFVPYLHENFEIKVTELRGLMTILVGTVTCDTASFFSARTQIMIVDITELGTIKLKLEVLWDPFDSGENYSYYGTTNKFSLGSRKASVYSWTPPNSPNFREKYYISVLQHRRDSPDMLSLIANEIHGYSMLSLLTNGSCKSHSRTTIHDKSETLESVSVEAERAETSFEILDSETVPLTTSEFVPTDERKQGQSAQQRGYQTPDILKQSAINHRHQTTSVTQPVLNKDAIGQSHLKKHHLNHNLSVNNTCTQNTTFVSNHGLKVDGAAYCIGKLLLEVLEKLKTPQEQWKELWCLEHQLLYIKASLKSKVLQQRSSSMESLTVETALDSFNFLDTQFSDDLSSLGSIRLRNTPTGTLHEGTLRNFGMLKDSLASGLRVPEELPLTTENDNVDMTLMIHLQVCNRLLQELASTKLANSVQNIVEELSHQTEVFEKLYAIYLEKAGNVKSAADVVPKTRKLKSALKFWNECTYSGTPLYCTADRMERRFLLNFKGKIKTKYHSYIDKVFKRFVEQISTSCGLLSSSAFPDVITLFQFCRYLNKRCAMGVAEQLDRLAKEVSLIEALQSPGRLKTLKKLKGKQISQLQPLHQTLKLLCALQLEENVRVSKAAKMGLLKASANRFFREKGVVYYTSLLKDRDVRLQQAACLALKLLKGVESIDEIASLCQSEDEDVRNAAREAVLSFGEKGRLAFEKMDKICCELQASLQEPETEITIL
ncbi:RIPOR family member 3 isoform X2 [Protopterus annectens]|uniref:RIPOR family member 3 isoform X2 n=1 Tax=Protopterus annectens TaxID=7888 RepID=UPI001CF98236|nr:RIPOR family member 3 isoform X2 [Protopterus annectens]